MAATRALVLLSQWPLPVYELNERASERAKEKKKKGKNVYTHTMANNSRAAKIEQDRGTRKKRRKRQKRQRRLTDGCGSAKVDAHVQASGESYSITYTHTHTNSLAGATSEAIHCDGCGIEQAKRAENNSTAADSLSLHLLLALSHLSAFSLALPPAHSHSPFII